MKNLLKISLIPLIIFLNNCPKKKSENEKLMQTVNDYTVLNGLVIKKGPYLKFYEKIDSENNVASVNFGYYYVDEFTSVTKTYYLKNPGDEATVIKSLKVYSNYNSRIESTNFTLDKTENITLAPGATTELKITFTAPKEKKSYSHGIYADTNAVDNKNSSLTGISAEVTGYALAKCGSNYTAIRVENQESVSKTLHLFNEGMDCYGNNTEIIPNSAAAFSFGPISPSSTTEYKCVEITSGNNSRSFGLSDGTGGDRGCSIYNSEIFIIKNQYKIIINSSLSEQHSVTAE